jgi:hypothetical protein
MQMPSIQEKTQQQESCPTEETAQEEMNPSAFKDFIVCKALDVISGNGAYRKYLHQCCENGEDWALKVAANVAAVGVVIKDLHALVDRVRRLPNSKLGKVCGEIVSSMHSPVRVIPGWSTCE